MRIRRLMIAAVVVVAAAPAVSFANGLLYKLPADGAKAVYAMKITSKVGDKEMVIKGSLSIASVGKDTVDGKACRWIEFQTKMAFQGISQTITAKLLIPEESLGKGKTPLKASKRSWIKLSERDVKELKDPSSREGWLLSAFLPGPLEDVKELKAKKIKTEFAELECKGLTGVGTADEKVTYEIRLSDKSPTGVATCKIILNRTRNGVARGKRTMEFTLKEVVKKGAESALPDKK